MVPVISPLKARSRKQMRHIWNLRRYACGRPHKGQRLYLRTLNLGLRFAWAIFESFAILSLSNVLDLDAQIIQIMALFGLAQ